MHNLSTLFDHVAFMTLMRAQLARSRTSGARSFRARASGFGPASSSACSRRVVRSYPVVTCSGGTIFVP